MIKNASQNENTLKSMISVMDSDNYTIDKALLYCTYDNENFHVAYLNILDDYADYFEQYLETIEVPKKYFYQPAAFAENYYGSADLDFLILYFAKMTDLSEFNRDKIKILPKSRLVEINRLFVQYRDYVKEKYNNPDKFMALPDF